jgi:hypothetical protein
MAIGSIVISGDNPSSGTAKITGGALHVVQGAIANPTKIIVGSSTASLASTGSQTIIAAQGTGTYLNITDLIISNSSTATTWVNICDAAAQKLTVYAPANSMNAISLQTPLRLSASSALTIICEATSAIRVSAAGFVS